VGAAGSIAVRSDAYLAIRLVVALRQIDEGNTWPISFALEELTAADEARIAELVKKAVS
jgi:hypothetical protein